MKEHLSKTLAEDTTFVADWSATNAGVSLLEASDMTYEGHTFAGWKLDGADVELSFEVRARVDEGIPVPTTRAISENCNTLHIGDYRFDG